VVVLEQKKIQGQKPKTPELSGAIYIFKPCITHKLVKVVYEARIFISENLN